MFHQDRIRAALEFEAKKAQQEMEKERKKRQVHFVRLVFFVLSTVLMKRLCALLYFFEEWTHRLTRRTNAAFI
jgi:hypothetical protein